MTEKEAQKRSFDLLAGSLGLDEFQKIAMSELMRDLEGFTWPPSPGSEHEKKLMELGSIVTGQRGSL